MEKQGGEQRDILKVKSVKNEKKNPVIVIRVMEILLGNMGGKETLNNVLAKYLIIIFNNN